MGKDDGRFAELAEHSSLFGRAVVVGRRWTGGAGPPRPAGARPIYESLLDRMLAAGERAA